MKLRKWQSDAFDIWWKTKKGIIKVVTGGGKTYFAIYAINEYLKKFPNNNILILVPSIQLLDQWMIEIKNNTKFSISLNGGGSALKSIAKINISTLGSLKNIYRKFDGDSTFLIVDECHKLGTQKKGDMLKKIWHSSLGLSATPERDFDENFEKIITPILGKIIFDYDYIKARKDKVISNFSMLNAYAPMLDDEVKEYENISKKIGKLVAIIGYLDNTDPALKNLLFKRARIVSNSFNRIPLAVKLINSLTANKWVVFSESKKQARLFHNIIGKNHRSAIYNTDIGIASRQKKY